MLWFILYTGRPAFSIEDSSNFSGSGAVDYAGTARFAGAGHASVASSLGLDSLYDNPAGMAENRRIELGVLNLNLLENTRYNFIGYVHPLAQKGTLGLGWASVNSYGFEALDSQNNSLGNFNDFQNIFYAGYGGSISRRLSAGVALKTFYHEIYRYRNTSAGMDAGVRYSFSNNLIGAVNLQNLISFPLQADGLKEEFPSVLRLGVSWTPDMPYSWAKKLQVQGEYDLVDLWGIQGGIVRNLDAWKAGVEYNVYDFLYLRGGFQANHVSLGLGARIMDIRLDYAYDIRSFGALHWVSLVAEIGDHVDRERINEYNQEALKALGRKDYPKAIGHWERILELESGNELAAKYLEKARDQQRQEIDRTLAAADQSIQNGDFDKAITILAEVERLDPGNPAAQAKKADVRARLEEKIRKEREDRIAEHIRAADNYEQQQNLPKALEEWQEVLALEPQRDQALQKAQALREMIIARIDQYFRRGYVLFEQGRYPEAIRQFQLVMQFDPSYHLAEYYLDQARTKMDEKVKRRYATGVRAFKGRQYPKAVEVFTEIAKWIPNYKHTKYYLEEAENRLKAWQAVQATVKAARVAGEQSNPSQVLLLLEPLIQKDNFDQDTLALFNRMERVVALSREQYQSGVRSYQDGDFEASIRAFRKSWELDHRSEAKNLLVDTYNRQGIQAYRRNDLEGAIKSWKTVLQIQPDYPMVDKYLKRAKTKLEYMRKLFLTR